MHNLHGITSLILFKVAVVAALVYLFFTSTAAGLIYLVLVIVASLAVLYAYCAKCQARAKCQTRAKCEARDNHCSHIFPGKATRWLPPRKQGAYSPADILVTGGSLALIFIFPQYWLWQNKAVLSTFWGLSIIAVAEILMRVCPACRNHNCMLCRKGG